MLDQLVEHFVDDGGHFRDTADDAPSLAYAPTDLTDGPTPSGTALAAGVLWEYAAMTGEDVFADQVWRTLAGAGRVIVEHPRFAAGLATVAEQFWSG